MLEAAVFGVGRELMALKGAHYVFSSSGMPCSAKIRSKRGITLLLEADFRMSTAVYREYLSVTMRRVCPFGASAKSALS